MEKIIKKTRFEINRDERKRKFTEILVKNTEYSHYYFVCDECDVAFFVEDIILRSKDGFKCPLIRNTGFDWIKAKFTDKRCLNPLSGGSSGDFDKFYKLK